MSSYVEISRELENINFNELFKQFPELKTSKKELRNTRITKHKRTKRCFTTKKVNSKQERNTEPKTQIESFQRAMKLLNIIGQCLGLNPVAGITEADYTKIRFSVLSWRFMYCVFIGIMQGLTTLLVLYKMTSMPLTIGSLGLFAFYVTACITTILYVQLGKKWQWLMRNLIDSALNEYIDPNVKFMCHSSIAVIIILAIVEHTLALASKIVSISNCVPSDQVIDEYLIQNFDFFYNIGLPVSHVTGFFLQLLNTLSTLNWNFSDVYIICLSIYLVSILKKINLRIVAASEKDFVEPAHWRSLREDYTKATRLVRSFDDVISGIVLTSFANNLFFICLQFFNIFIHGLHNVDNANKSCKYFSNAKYIGYVYKGYIVFSALYLLARSLTVSLVAADVHSASMAPANALYNVPSSSYCSEVARFLDQVHSSPVALSGLQFFYVTRDIVLTVAGTLVTYELVLLQVSGVEDMPITSWQN